MLTANLGWLCDACTSQRYEARNPTRDTDPITVDMVRPSGWKCGTDGTVACAHCMTQLELHVRELPRVDGAGVIRLDTAGLPYTAAE